MSWAEYQIYLKIKPMYVADADDYISAVEF